MKKRHIEKKSAFTKTELVIVISIITILALIAVPNFMETGNRVPHGSRVRSDHRSLATAIETYFIDHSVYPPMSELSSTMKPSLQKKADKALREKGGEKLMSLSVDITTPIAYITSMFPDPFAPYRGMPFVYYKDDHGWILISPFRDLDYDIADPALVYNGALTPEENERNLIPYTYDPTNGTMSDGDLWRICTDPKNLSEAGNESVEELPIKAQEDWRQYDPTNGTTGGSGIYRFKQ